LTDAGATLPDAAALFAAIDATWAPASRRRLGPWTLRQGRGGGKRVSAATAEAPVGPDDPEHAERAMARLDQRPLFMIRESDAALDRTLAERGYKVIDPVTLYAAPTAALAQAPLPPLSVFDIWPPLAIMTDLWATGGIGAGRTAVMDRVDAPKSAILARHADQPAGVAFVAAHAGIAMIHAIVVRPDMRRKGLGGNMLRKAARWGQDHGATSLALAVTRANTAANALYASHRMVVVGHYHYRIK